MHIVRLEAENFKRLKVVNVTPVGSVIQVTGANGSGKSSLLDAIFAALCGEGASPEKPIREGEQSARITLDLGTVTVTRRYEQGKKSVLTVESEDFGESRSPQTLLNKLVGALTFDPLEFTRLKPREQHDALGRLVGVTDTLKRLDAERRTAFENRATVNRDLKAAAAECARLGSYEAVEPVDVATLMEEIAQAEATNRAIEHQHAVVEKKKSRIAQLENELERLRAAYAQCEAEMVATTQQLDAMVTGAVIDVAPLREQIVNAQAINAAVERNRQRDEARERHAVFVMNSEDLSIEIDAIDQAKADVVAAAPMPVPDLGFGEEGITYKGQPFEQASGAEQLRVSMAIAMAANPKLRILRVKDGSLLDSQSLAIVTEMVRGQNFQLWLERVDESGNIGIVMEDGEVAPDPFADVEDELTHVGAI